MEIVAPGLRQRDGVTCGPSVALMAGALLDPARRAALTDPDAGQARFDAEQVRLHAAVNRLWPRRLGMTPWAMARALTDQASTAGVPYRWRWCRGRCDATADVLGALDRDRPVGMLIGAFIPRHWVLIVDASRSTLTCYEPSSGQVRTVDVTAVRQGRLVGVGYPRVFAFALPCSNV